MFLANNPEADYKEKNGKSKLHGDRFHLCSIAELWIDVKYLARNAGLYNKAERERREDGRQNQTGREFLPARPACPI